jgi:hypothetical protein
MTMPKIDPLAQAIFANNAPAGAIGQFGSFAAGTPVTTTNPAAVQDVPEYDAGWTAAVVAGNAPCIEDMNGLFFLITSQIAQLQQTGLSEWNAQTTYYKGSLVRDSTGRFIFVSTVDGNFNIPPTNGSLWNLYASAVRDVTTTQFILTSDNTIRSNSTAGDIVLTLPLIADTYVGQKITVKDIGIGGHTTTLQARGSETIDGTTIYPTALPLNGFITVQCTGHTWDVIGIGLV